MRHWSFFIAIGVTLLPASALATPNFPPAIQSQLGLNAPPPCGTCHTTGEQGGLGTVNTLFGISMRNRGLVAEDENSLRTALAALEAAGKDSDGDGVVDIAELRAGTNPSGDDAEPASTGCGAQISPASTGSWGFAGAFALAMAAIWRRRRTRYT